LQIEVNRGLYMDEHQLEPHQGFARLTADLARLAQALLSLVEQREAPREAAE
jgi:N-formylglutamate amidohydrolase